MYQKYCYEQEHADLLSIAEEGKRHCFLIKSFNTLRYGHTLHCGRNYF